MSITFDTERIGGWIFVHTRAYDSVHFGPFATFEDLQEWLRSNETLVTGMAVPLVNPSSDPLRFWEKLY
jgi:hypothetical protein